jgi:class 3 adenylate cyclase
LAKALLSASGRGGFVGINYLPNSEIYRFPEAAQILNDKNLVMRRNPRVALVIPSRGQAPLINSPVGRIPVSFLNASIAANALSGNWIVRPSLAKQLAISALVFLLVGFAFAAIRDHFVMALLPIAAVAISAFLYAYLNFFALGMADALFAVGLMTTTIAHKYSVSRNTANRLRAVLAQSMSEGQVAELMRSGHELDLSPKGRVVTVMFVDIVQFSMVSECVSAEESFKELRGIIQRISAIIHSHNGIIDNIMGDGIIAFFGCHYDGRVSDQDHADRGLNCAIEIQLRNIRGELRSSNSRIPVMPLRIGVNTAGVVAGDICGNGISTPTIIGDGVIMAKRLEEACEPHRILVGTSTKSLQTKEIKREIHPRDISIKHGRELIRAWEVTPYTVQESNALRAITESHRSHLKIKRRFDRLPLPEPVHADAAAFKGMIVNVSAGGLAFAGQHYIGRKTVVELSLRGDNELTQALGKVGIFSILCEVKWGGFDEASGTYLHGLEFRNLSTFQGEKLVQILTRGRTHLREVG